jgi:hypothetical protein
MADVSFPRTVLARHAAAPRARPHDTHGGILQALAGVV